MKRSPMPAPKTGLKRTAMARSGTTLPKRRRKSRTKADQASMNAVAGVGCIACCMDGHPGTPPELHHPRAGTGGGQKAPDSDVIPLCPPHHRGTMHPVVPSIHLDKLKFIARYGTEGELLAVVRAIIERGK